MEGAVYLGGTSGCIWLAHMGARVPQAHERHTLVQAWPSRHRMDEVAVCFGARPQQKSEQRHGHRRLPAAPARATPAHGRKGVTGVTGVG